MSKKAFLFPGQGSQKIGMLSAAAMMFPEVNETFAEASEIVGYDMWSLLQTGEQAEINMTEVTQPILLTASVALWRVCQAKGVSVDYLAGHSLGEFSALVCAGVIDFAAAVNLVKLRGQFMQTAVPPGVGAMAAIIGLEDAVIDSACQQVVGNQCVQAVNYNSPGQVVIAGHKEAVELAINELKTLGAKKAMPLPVSAPFHTDLMRPAGEKLAEVMQNLSFSTPKIPIIHNVHAAAESNPDKIRQLMVEQIYSPVRWSACVKEIAQYGVVDFVECGPSKVLTGLCKRIDKGLQCNPIEEPDALLKCLETI